MDAAGRDDMVREERLAMTRQKNFVPKRAILILEVPGHFAKLGEISPGVLG